MYLVDMGVGIHNQIIGFVWQESDPDAAAYETTPYQPSCHIQRQLFNSNFYNHAHRLRL